MLVLTRKIGESVLIGDESEPDFAGSIKIIEITGKKVKMGFTFPKAVPILRDDAVYTSPNPSKANIERSKME